MGDAKRRGTFEERKAAAIASQKIVEASKTPKQRFSRNRSMMELMMMLGMMGAYNPPYKSR